MRKLSRAVALASALCALAATLPAQAVGSRVGQRAPAVTLPTLDGAQLDLGQLIGETPVVLHFFAAWCSQCRAQMPSLHNAVARYGSSVRFVGVAVSANQSLTRAKRYAESHAMKHDLAYDARGAAVEAYNVPTTSYVVAVDKSGRIVFTGSGPDLDFSAAAALATRGR
jgi:peroxiredoxin